MSPGDRREPFADNRFPPLLVNVASKRESREFSTSVLSYRDDLLPGNVSDKRMIHLLTHGLPTQRQPRNGLRSEKMAPFVSKRKAQIDRSSYNDYRRHVAN